MPRINRQSVSYLTRRFKEVGLRPDKRRGQNFLIDLNLIQLLANSAEVSDRDVVLEVGTGTGSLTGLLAPLAAVVVTVEIDSHLCQLASEELVDYDNVEMLHQDALKNKNNFDPRVLDAVQQHLDAAPERQFKLVSNLPYSVATPIIANLLSGDVTPTSMTVTIQKELADRILAGPGTKNYGALSIWMQSQCRVSLVRVLPPNVFWPRPKVDSAIIHIEVDSSLRDRIEDLNFFHQFVRSMFFHRRKFLRSVLISAMKGNLDKPAVDEIMDELGLAADSRAEQLDVERMLELSRAVQARLES